MSTDLALARLLQLASPTLPVGAYSYSRGLEAAAEAGVVRDERPFAFTKLKTGSGLATIVEFIQRQGLMQ